MTSLHRIVDQYLTARPDERTKLARLEALLTTSTDALQLISRKNFTGHVTASGFVIDPTQHAIALIHHTSLAMYVQPGGHLEVTDATPLAGARREVLEETGMRALTYHPMADDDMVPLDIDSHYIPPNPKKGEPEHWHHDFRYLFTRAESSEPIAESAESDVRWISLDTLDQFETFEVVASKIREAVAPYLRR